MAEVVPTILADTAVEYNRLLQQVAPFAKRLHLDFMDGMFAPTRSINVIEAHWPQDKYVDLHLMLKNPVEVLETVISMAPGLAIVHVEAGGDLKSFIEQARAVGIKAGVALLAPTKVSEVADLIQLADHVLVFAGNLGHYGGELDETVLAKIKQIKAQKPEIEVGVDGGVNDKNARLIVEAGADVLYSGGYIQKSDDPKLAYDTLVKIANKASSKK